MRPGRYPKSSTVCFFFCARPSTSSATFAGVIIPAMDEYRRRKTYKGLNEIRNLLATSAGIPARLTEWDGRRYRPV